MSEVGAPVGFIGTPIDRAIIESRGVVIAEDDNFTNLACLGLYGARMDAADYLADIEPLADAYGWAGSFHCSHHNGAGGGLRLEIEFRVNRLHSHPDKISRV